MHVEPSASQPLDAATLLDEVVRVDFVKFVPVDHRGNELPENPSLGYVVYNGEHREFGLRTFEGSDSYTLDHDVWVAMTQHHPEMAETAASMGGFCLNGLWSTANGRVEARLQ